MDVGYRQIISLSAILLIITLAVISTVGLTTLFDHSGAGLSIHGIVNPRHDGATPHLRPTNPIAKSTPAPPEPEQNPRRKEVEDGRY